MDAMTASATAMPGVRSRSMRTRSGSIAIRAACRYSSRRCAAGPAPAPMTIAAARAVATTLLRDQLRTVVVGRVPIDRVDVIDAALRRVLDHQRRALDAEVGGAAVGGRAAPREPRLRQVGPDL